LGPFLSPGVGKSDVLVSFWSVFVARREEIIRFGFILGRFLGQLGGGVLFAPPLPNDGGPPLGLPPNHHSIHINDYHYIYHLRARRVGGFYKELPVPGSVLNQNSGCLIRNFLYQVVCRINAELI
jgi:hypothetical protein